MPRRTDIHSILIIGSGPIVIGQACEFDYSGTQACKALRELGYRIILVNSNPATIMTDPVMADATYIEPLTVERLEEIIAKERPDALLPNLGGQTALNLASALDSAGILQKYEVEVIGVNLRAIERGEDREIFKKMMEEIGIDAPRSEIAHTVDEAVSIAERLCYPVVVRPAYTMGGAGGGLVYNVEEMRSTVERGLELSMTHQCLIEESILGWEELEVEVVRDAKGQMIAACFIENIDAVGVHTGDSFCAAPYITIEKSLEERLKEQAFRIVDSVGVIGGTNAQFAYNRAEDRIVIIEINPRTSRSSALASKATGFPIALVSAKLAVGYTLDELHYWRDGSLDLYTPQDDYVVVKFARWAFEKFHNVKDELGTQMKAVGEVMAIGKTFKETFQKAIRGLENGRAGLGFAKDFNERSLGELIDMLRTATSERHFVIYEALRKGATVDQICALTYLKPYFVEQVKELVELEEEILLHKGGLPPDELLTRAKKEGFSDKYLSQILAITEKELREKRTAIGVVEGWHPIPVADQSDNFYYYSSYNAPDTSPPRSDKKKVMILGGGPNRIGQGIEFDYCCVHAAFALRDMGYETIMVNCNPETVSTDYDTSDKLYFEPVSLEDVLQIYNKEQPEGVVVQFGGQTPLNIARELADAGVRILGTSIDSIDTAEDRDLFRMMMEKLEIPMPEAGMALNLDEAVEVANRIGYPLMIRPSFVLGGRGMEVIYDESMLREYVARAVDITPDRPLLLDRFLRNAIECEADALSDGKEVYIPAVMEHIELAGVHSGDSACILPPVSISDKLLETIQDYTRKIADALGVCGLMNMQYAIENDKVYVIEANPRASRTVPLVSKVCNTQMARLATQLMLGEKMDELNLKEKKFNHFGAKEAVFPFDKFTGVDPILGPEMRSTGEVLGLSTNPSLAFYKSQQAAGADLPAGGTVLISLSDKENLQEQSIAIGRAFVDLGFKLVGTEGTAAFFNNAEVPCQPIWKIAEGRPNVVDLIVNRQVQLVINTPWPLRDVIADEEVIRKAALKYKIPYITTLAAAWNAVQGIKAAREGSKGVQSLQEYHASIVEL